MDRKGIPDGYHSVTPHLMIDGAARAIRFYEKAFGAKEVLRLPMPGPDGGERIAHAELRIGDSIVMIADEFPDMNLKAPAKDAPFSASLMIYVADCDAVFAQAVAAGAKAEREPKDEFYGDRTGVLVDPFGHRWLIATSFEQMSEAEMRRRMAAEYGG